MSEQMRVNEAGPQTPHISHTIISYMYKKEQELEHGITANVQTLNISKY